MSVLRATPDATPGGCKALTEAACLHVPPRRGRPQPVLHRTKATHEATVGLVHPLPDPLVELDRPPDPVTLDLQVDPQDALAEQTAVLDAEDILHAEPSEP